MAYALLAPCLTSQEQSVFWFLSPVNHSPCFWLYSAEKAGLRNLSLVWELAWQTHICIFLSEMLEGEMTLDSLTHDCLAQACLGSMVFRLVSPNLATLTVVQNAEMQQIERIPRHGNHAVTGESVTLWMAFCRVTVNDTKAQAAEVATLKPTAAVPLRDLFCFSRSYTKSTKTTPLYNKYSLLYTHQCTRQGVSAFTVFSTALFSQSFLFS